MLNYIISILFLFLSLTIDVNASNIFTSKMDHESLQLYQNILGLTQIIIRKGHKDYDFALGANYATGCGVTINYHKAFEHFSISASKGYREPQFFLGLMYEAGFAVNKDIKTAIEFYKASDSKGFCLATYRLAVINYIGLGVPKDDNKAADYYSNVVSRQLNYYNLFLIASQFPATLRIYVNSNQSGPVIQHSYIDQFKLLEYEDRVRKLIPNVNIRYKDLTFSSKVKIQGNNYNVETDAAILIHHTKNGLIFTEDIRECCIITLFNAKTHAAGLAHYVPNDKNTLMERLKKVINDHHQKTPHHVTKELDVAIFSGFFSNHLINLCDVLKSLGYPPKMINCAPIVCEMENIGNYNRVISTAHHFYPPDRYFYNASYKELYPNYTTLKFPRKVALDIETGEIATM